MITGVVADQGGPVAGATVAAVGGGKAGSSTITSSDGTYSLRVPAGTYEVGAQPPPGSTDGFASFAGVVVGEGQTVAANVTLATSAGSGEVVGDAFYADHSPDAGVAVTVYEHRQNGYIGGETLYTDEAGNWATQPLPSGIYDISYVVNTVDPGSGHVTGETLASEMVFIHAGQTTSIAKALSGRKPQGMIEATVTAAEGWLEYGQVSLAFPAAQEVAYPEANRVFHLFAPAGTYALTATPEGPLDDAAASMPVSVSDGHATTVNIRLSPLGIPTGISAENTDTDLSWLNHQRSRWGLPGDLVNVPIWSDACAAHDAYEAQNNVVEHEEYLPGATPGGNWAGTNAVLAGHGAWGEEVNPWMDAPIHLDQLFAPGLKKIGIDDSHDDQCATTWPGIYQDILEARERPGVVYTFPGDGATGLPPVEYASELPSTPNENLGISDLSGRELFVYESGTEFNNPDLTVVSASLTAGSESVELMRYEHAGEPGAIIIPVQPLKPFTTYHASVTLAEIKTSAGKVAPELTHDWSFTTGQDNPKGGWVEPTEPSGGPPVVHGVAPRKLRARWRRGHVIVKGWHFESGQVVIRRMVSRKGKKKRNGKVLARSRVRAGGSFSARFRWPRRRIRLRVYQRGKSTPVTCDPPHLRLHHRRHRHHHRRRRQASRHHKRA